MNKTVFSLSALLAASLLFGCHGESVTGPPMGPTALTGQVVTTGDLAGASPAGISVTCSGQVSVTDATGRFVFASISSQSMGRLSALSSAAYNMRFTRNDGINAAGSVSASSSDVTVYLQKSQAQIVSTGQAKRELEGVITQVSTSSITVNDASSGPQTAAINDSTVIRKGNQPVKAADLNAGDRVHVKATVNSDNTLTAFEIIVQSSGNDNGGGQTKELEGPITKISATSITVNNASTGGPVTAKIDGSTVIRRGNNSNLTWHDLSVGDRVHVKTTGSGDSLTATEILLQNPA